MTPHKDSSDQAADEARASRSESSAPSAGDEIERARAAYDAQLARIPLPLRGVWDAASTALECMRCATGWARKREPETPPQYEYRRRRFARCILAAGRWRDDLFKALPELDHDLTLAAPAGGAKWRHHSADHAHELVEYTVEESIGEIEMAVEKAKYPDLDVHQLIRKDFLEGGKGPTEADYVEHFEVAAAAARKFPTPEMQEFEDLYTKLKQEMLGVRQNWIMTGRCSVDGQLLETADSKAGTRPPEARSTPETDGSCPDLPGAGLRRPPPATPGEESEGQAPSPETDAVDDESGEKKRPCYDRDHELCDLADEAGRRNITTPWAWVRNQYNAGHPKHKIPQGRSGRDLIRKAVKKARKERAAENS